MNTSVLTSEELREPSLPVRPKADVILVSDILGMAVDGQLRVPEFQTGLRWKGRQVEDLFDSIVRGFPIGSLLLWKKPADSQRVRFGPLAVNAEQRGDSLQIVDGQQRVTTLVASLLHPDEVPIGGAFAAWVNLRSGEFKVHSSKPTSSLWLPLNVLGSRVKLQHWARAVDLGRETDALVNQAFKLEESITRYGIPSYVVSNADSNALRLIFKRANSSGVSLKEAEVFQALFGTNDEAKPLESMAKAIQDETGFGDLSIAWLLRCVKSVGDCDPKYNFTESRPPSSDLIGETRESFRRVVRFLQQETGFIHSAVLPYRFPIIILSRFFHIHPEPSLRTRTLLTRWIWRGALSGVHSDSSHAAVSSNLTDIGDDEDESVQRLLVRVPNSYEMPTASGAWNGNAAGTRLFATLMLASPPFHPDTEQPWEREELLEALTKRQLGESFKTIAGPPNGAIAFRAFCPPGGQPVDPLGDSPDVLTSHYIPHEAVEALQNSDPTGFGRARETALIARITEMASRYSSPDLSDRPPIRRLLETAQ